MLIGYICAHYDRVFLIFFVSETSIEKNRSFFGIVITFQVQFRLGPLVSFGLFSHSETDTRRINLYKKDPTSDRAAIRRWDFGAGIMIGYETKCNLQFNFNFQLGFRNMFDASYENVELFSVGVGVGYRF